MQWEESVLTQGIISDEPYSCRLSLISFVYRSDQYNQELTENKGKLKCDFQRRFNNAISDSLSFLSGISCSSSM